ncbi:MAG: parallel beta-helix domain-containing protein, partial [Planctomycetota bacterium]
MKSQHHHQSKRSRPNVTGNSDRHRIVRIGPFLTAAVFTIWLLGFALVGHAEKPTRDTAAKNATPRVTVISPSGDCQFDLQAALIDAIPGDTIELAEGTFEFTSELNLVCDNLTIRGAGMDKTILSFKDQDSGSEGIVSTGNAFVIENLTVQDTAGNAIKVLGAKDVTFRNVKVEWTGGPKSTNGAYGIYPVECSNVLIENCVSIAASDAGIYVGQSRDVVVRGCLATRNVAGIEIENTIRADVYQNKAVDNTGGILVFDLPGLNVTNGRHVRVFDNEIINNNHTNFAPRGTIVSTVPPGTGLMVMATDEVEVFENTINNHHTSSVSIISFLITERKIKDKKYDPFPESISIHDNQISKGGYSPKGELGKRLKPLVGKTFPDIFYDGIVDEKKFKGGKLPPSLGISIRNNGDATFANVDVANLSLKNYALGRYKIDRNIANYSSEFPRLEQVKLTAHAAAQSGGNPAVEVYRSAPKMLSSWNLFERKDGKWQPADDLLVYQLNTPLFSDYTVKHRFIRLPEGQSMNWHSQQVLDFPVGTVIAKTFAYPDKENDDATADERFLETRIEFRNENGWYGYSYVWNEEQSDAELHLGGANIDASWTDAEGTKHENAYKVPNANQC